MCECFKKQNGYWYSEVFATGAFATASRRGFLGIVRVLVKFGASLDTSDSFYMGS